MPGGLPQVVADNSFEVVSRFDGPNVGRFEAKPGQEADEPAANVACQVSWARGSGPKVQVVVDDPEAEELAGRHGPERSHDSPSLGFVSGKRRPTLGGEGEVGHVHVRPLATGGPLRKPLPA